MPISLHPCKITPHNNNKALFKYLVLITHEYREKLWCGYKVNAHVWRWFVFFAQSYCTWKKFHRQLFPKFAVNMSKNHHPHPLYVLYDDLKLTRLKLKIDSLSMPKTRKDANSTGLRSTFNVYQSVYFHAKHLQIAATYQRQEKMPTWPDWEVNILRIPRCRKQPTYQDCSRSLIYWTQPYQSACSLTCHSIVHTV